MNKQFIVIGIVLLVLIVGGGWFVMQSSKTVPVPTEAPEIITPEESLAPDKAENESTDAATTTGEVKEFTVEGSAFKFVPAQIKVKKGDTVKITFVNKGGSHDFVIDELDVATKQLGAGESETVEFVADKAGTFEYYCSVGNHRAQGMKGNLVVE